MSAEPLSRRDREDMLKLVRSRERVAKSMASARSAALMADFEAQLDRQYAYDEDAIWQAAAEFAKEAVAMARGRIAERCGELGIPAQFAPDLSVQWYARGRNAMEGERQQMRRLAKRRIEQIEASARLEIERASVQAQERLWTDGLTSDAAQTFLASLPTVEGLMPTLNLQEVQAALATPKSLAQPPAFPMLEDD
jgi:hypothetical protein